MISFLDTNKTALSYLAGLTLPFKLVPFYEQSDRIYDRGQRLCI